MRDLRENQRWKDHEQVMIGASKGLRENRRQKDDDPLQQGMNDAWKTWRYASTDQHDSRDSETEFLTPHLETWGDEQRPPHHKKYDESDDETLLWAVWMGPRQEQIRKSCRRWVIKDGVAQAW